jgi:hypothetical protein
MTPAQPPAYQIDRTAMAAYPSHLLASTSGCRWLMLAAQMAGLANGGWRPAPYPPATGRVCPPRSPTRARRHQCREDPPLSPRPAAHCTSSARSVTNGATPPHQPAPERSYGPCSPHGQRGFHGRYPGRASRRPGPAQQPDELSETLQGPNTSSSPLTCKVLERDNAAIAPSAVVGRASRLTAAAGQLAYVPYVSER